jgi:hypothetical protein
MECLRTRPSALLVLIAGCLAFAACSDNDSSHEHGDPDIGAPDIGTGEDVSSVEPTYTYYADIKPVVDASCTPCHQEGAISTLPLTNYQEVFAARQLVNGHVAARTMPPWLAGPGCTEYEHDLSLSDADIEMITTWVSEGAPAGDPSNEGSPRSRPVVDLERVDAVVSMPVDYIPVASPDDYRCFPIDWEADAVKYITGFNVVPGNPEIVHHVIAYYAPPALVAEVEAKEAAEEGPGYTCFGSPGVGDQSRAGQDGNIAWLGSWAPGGQAERFPEGTGLRLEPGSKIILQVHYNTYGSQRPSDRTSLELTLTDRVDKPARFLPWANPSWIGSETAMRIPAGDDDVTHRFGFDLASVAGRPVKIYSANLHMHLLGKSARMWINHNAEQTCLLDVPRWDFNWQFSYRFAEPKILRPGQQLFIECTWDNSPANQPVINGERLLPRDVHWGDGTTDEMCLGIFYVTFGED